MAPPIRGFTVPRKGFGVNAGNHADTVRITYTVPADRIAKVTSGAMILGTQTGITFAQTQIRLVINGGVYLTLQNTLTFGNDIVSFGNIDLIAGDVIDIRTNNASAVLVEYSGMLMITEYQ